MSEITVFEPAPSVFGFGALAKLPEELKSRGFRGLLVITLRQIASSGIIDRVLDLLKKQNTADQDQSAASRRRSPRPHSERDLKAD